MCFIAVMAGVYAYMVAALTVAVYFDLPIEVQ